MLLGALTKEMNSNGLLFPRPTFPLLGHSFAETMETVLNFRSPGWCNRANRNSGYKSYCREHTCNLATAIDSRVVELSSRLKGLELIDFRTGM